MAFSLYDATIPTFIQILEATGRLTERAEAFCAEEGKDPAELLECHFGPDMLPLKWQLKWVSSHSIGAIEGVRRGNFSPDREPPTQDLAGFRGQIGETLAALRAIAREEVESFIGRDMAFTMGERRIEFTAENFLMSFSLPNFMFHATTAYTLLRHEGISLGKRDFLGSLQIKAPAPA